jgi:hypothetical protein
MNERDAERVPDSLEVEFTDLDEAGAATQPSRLASLLAAFPPDRRYRRPITVATASLVVLAVMMIFATSFPVRAFLANSNVKSPTQPGPYTYIIQATPPWGRLFVDGHAVQFYAREGSPSIILTPGRHVLAWRADPFAQQQCTMQVPPGSGIDTCKHLPLQVTANGFEVADTIIVFQASLSLLKAETRAALMQAAQHALDLHQSSETVQPGEVYAVSSLSFNPPVKACAVAPTAALCYQSAKQALQATVSFQLDTDTSSSAPCNNGGACIYNGEDCRLFCDATAYDTPIASPSPTRWNAFAIVHILWHYRTPQGQLVIPPEADSFIWGQQDEYPIPLSIAWNGATWNVTTRFDSAQAPLDNPMCDAAIDDIGTLLYADARTTYSFDSIPAPTFALGCLIKVQLVNVPAAPAPSAYLLDRFGVMLAANNEAHHLLPFLPLADGYEIGLAKLLGAQ